jgi:hypothetical protein
MLRPAVYPLDPTLGITDPQMLPSPKVVLRSRNYPHRPCPGLRPVLSSGAGPDSQPP